MRSDDGACAGETERESERALVRAQRARSHLRRAIRARHAYQWAFEVSRTHLERGSGDVDRCHIVLKDRATLANRGQSCHGALAARDTWASYRASATRRRKPAGPARRAPMPAGQSSGRVCFLLRRVRASAPSIRGVSLGITQGAHGDNSPPLGITQGVPGDNLNRAAPPPAAPGGITRVRLGITFYIFPIQTLQWGCRGG